MKLKVNRLLTAGVYRISFEVGDFTPDEISKMSSFGVPQIDVKWTYKGNPVNAKVAITQLSKSQEAGFSNKEEAEQYEEGVVAQIRNVLERLREQEDEYSSSTEVNL